MAAASPKTSTVSLALIGAGRMGGAMLRGWLDAGLFAAEKVFVFEPNASDDLSALAQDRGFALNPAIDDVAKAGVTHVVLAVKPQVMADVVPLYAGLWVDSAALPLTLSIAAGVSLASLAGMVPAGTPIIRSMPNTPASIGLGVTAIIGNEQVDDAAYAAAEQMLGAVGKTVRLENEGQMDAVTAVSGSGPAYIFHLAEAMAAAGMRAGLPEDMASTLARETVAGAAALLADAADQTPAQLREAVTSPGGTTAAALDILMSDQGLIDLMSRAIAAAAARSQELDQG